MKRYSSMSFVLLVMVALLVAACTGTAPPVAEKPTDTPTAIPPSPTPAPPEDTPTAIPPTATVAAPSEKPAAETTPTPLPSPTKPPAPTATATAVDWLTVQGRTADGLPTLGNPDAPVQVIDYSDFL